MTRNAPERPFRTLLVLAALFGSVYLFYLAAIGESDTKFHVYYENGSKDENCDVIITNKDTGEVVKDKSLKRREGLTYHAKHAGIYEIKASALNKIYEVNVASRDEGGTRDVLIYINEGDQRNVSDKVWLVPLFYLIGSGAETEARLKDYARHHPEYEYTSTYNELPVRVDYGFSEPVPKTKSEGDEKKAYYVLADKKRLNKIERASAF